MINTKIALVWAAVAVLAVAAAPKASAEAVDLVDARQAMDEFLAAAQGCFNITGLIAEVTNSSMPLYRQAMGVRDIVKKLPVDNHTAFGIGSTTKAFTSVLTAMLAAEGKISFDTLVADVVSDFGLDAQWASPQVTLQDLASHKTGVPRNDLLWFLGTPDTGSEIQDNTWRLKHFPAVQSFRSGFLYNNWMVATVGAAAAAAANTTWQKLVQERILTPLGMNETYVSVADAVSSNNYAIPVATDAITGKTVQLPADVNALLEPVAPAGIISATAADMGKWMRLHLNLGAATPGGKQLVPTANLVSTYNQNNFFGTLAIEAGAPKIPEALSMWAYGAGWFLGNLGPNTWISHGGDSLGHHSIVSLTHNLGVFFSGYGVNEDAIATVRNLLASYANDVFNGREPWVNASTVCNYKPQPRDAGTGDELFDVAARDELRARGMPVGRAVLHSTRLSPDRHELLRIIRQHADVAAAEPKRAAPAPSAYVGEYANDGWGTIEVVSDSSTSSGLLLRFESFQANVTIEASGDLSISPSTSPYNIMLPPGLPVTVSISGSTVDSMTISWFEATAPPVFTRK